MEFDLCDYDRFALYDPAFYGIKDLISDEDFILFHTIDRKLFSMLICKLGRNVDESMHVVAFLIWLEKIRYSHNAVFKVIAWPLHLVYQLANEVAAFLMCLKNTDLGKEYINLSLLRKLCSRHINLVQFHEKRITILESVNKIVAEDCMRAFKDIVTSNVEFSDMEGDQMWYACSNSVCVPPPYLPNVVGTGYFPQLEFCRNSGSINSIQPSYQLENILEDPNADLSEFFGGMQLVNSFKDESDVAPDDRTIFLTFSKGYYIPELEIREFFTRYILL